MSSRLENPQYMNRTDDDVALMQTPLRRRQSYVPAALCSAVVCLLLLIIAPADAQTYTLERLPGNYNQPVYITQAPGDNNLLYIVERTDVNGVGRVLQLDQQTGTSSIFLDVSGTVNLDGGLLAMAFHPDFQSNGLFYTNHVDGLVNRLSEYQVVGGTPQFSRTLLEYSSNNANHTIDWLGFRPGGGSNELFVTTGDGGWQANDSRFDAALIESTDSIYGKLLSVDLAATFNTPVGSGLDADNRVNVVATGLRNPFRASFDSQGGLFLGDVGYNQVEEFNYVPADVFDSPPAVPINFGWTDREGTIETLASNAGGAKVAGDIDPIFDYLHPHVSGVPSEFHNGNDQTTAAGDVVRGHSAIGGYEFEGRYFFADYQAGGYNGIGAITGDERGAVYSGVFDTNTPTSSFDGTNLTDIQDHTNDFEIAVNDDIDFISSFGTDNAGNLYIIDFGDGNPYYPDPNSGEIFRIVKTPEPASGLILALGVLMSMVFAGRGSYGIPSSRDRATYKDRRND